MEIPEELLHFIWRFRLFDQLNLKTTDSATVKISNVGVPNVDAGPDFTMAKIRIGDTDWVGDIEIHKYESDWALHTHHTDKVYNKVVLHVIWTKTEQRQYREDGTILPTLVLSEYVKPALIEHYHQLMRNRTWIACEEGLSSVDQLVKDQLVHRMSVERLERRYELVLERLNKSNQDWEAVFQTLLFRSFGMKVNNEAFERLADCIPKNFLERKKADLQTLSALLYGQAGMLEQNLIHDGYYNGMRREYLQLKQGMQLKGMDGREWKFMRMRPANFPTLRIAQLAALLNQTAISLSAVIACNDLNELISPLRKVKVEDYWNTHYTFGKETKKKKTGISESFCRHLVVNVFALVRFSYGKYYGEPKHCEMALEWLQALKGESNTVVKRFKELGMQVHNLLESQGCIHLKKEYCDQFKCLQCSVGLHQLRV